jgi:hypothetical protein
MLSFVLGIGCVLLGWKQIFADFVSLFGYIFIAVGDPIINREVGNVINWFIQATFLCLSGART